MPSPAPDTCLCYLVRHGATESNLATPPILQGRGVDMGLSVRGRRQAEAVAGLLAEMGPAAVYSSTMVRARETAEIIARPHGLIVESLESLVEVDVGRWEGLSWEEIERLEPEAHRLFRENPERHGYRGGETVKEVERRVTPAIRSIMERHPGKPVAVVGHSVVNRSFLAGVLDLPLSSARGLTQDNGGVNVIRLRGGKLKLLTMNSTFHLLDA